MALLSQPLFWGEVEPKHPEALGNSLSHLTLTFFRMLLALTSRSKVRSNTSCQALTFLPLGPHTRGAVVALVSLEASGFAQVEALLKGQQNVASEGQPCPVD